MGIEGANADDSVVGPRIQLEWSMPNMASATDGHGFEGAVRQAEYFAATLTWPSLSPAPAPAPTDFIGNYNRDVKYLATKSPTISPSSNNGVDLVVGAGNNVETLAQDQLFVHRKIVQIHTVANDTQFGIGTLVPYKIQTVPVESFQGMVLQQILCLPEFNGGLNSSRIVIFFSPNIYGIKARMESKDGTYCAIEVLAELIVENAPQDYTTTLAQLAALDVSPRFFLFHTDALTASQIIAQGTTLGIFGEGVQFFGPAQVTVPLLVNNNVSGTAETTIGFSSVAHFQSVNTIISRKQIAKSMKGYLGIHYAPSYGLRGAALGGTEVGANYVKSFAALDATINCNVKDSLGNYPFRQTGGSGGACVFDSTVIEITGATTSNGFVAITFTASQPVKEGMLLSWAGQTNTLVRCAILTTPTPTPSPSPSCTLSSPVSASALSALPTPIFAVASFHFAATFEGSASTSGILIVESVISGILRAGSIVIGGTYSNHLPTGTKITSCTPATISKGMSGTCALSLSSPITADIPGQSYFAATFSFAALGGSSHGHEINPFAPHSFDAIYAAGHALRLMEESTPPTASWDSDLLVNLLMINVSYTGATGNVHFFQGMQQSFGGYARGDREQGHTYTLWNFNEDAYLSGALDNSVFNYVGTWNIVTDEEGAYMSGGVKWCTSTSSNSFYSDVDGYYPCQKMVWNTPENTIPSINSPYHYDTPPKVVKLGGFFSPIDPVTGLINTDQIQALAAFYMAVRDVNAASFNTNFKLATAVASGSDFVSAVSAAAYFLNDAFTGTGVDIVVGAGGDDATMAMDAMYNSAKLVQIHALAQSTLLGDGLVYHYKVQTVPIDSFMGMALQSMMCDTYNYHKTAVFATNDDMGTKSSMESGDGTYCEISKLSTSTVRFDLGLSDGKVDLAQWDSEIDNALYGGARVFLLFMPPETAARLLVRGYDKGLFREGTQIFMSKVALTPVLTETVNSITMSKEKTKAVLKGIIGISFAPAFNWRYPAGFIRPNVPEQDPYNLMPKEAHEFIDAFKSLASTAGTPDSTTGLIDCDQARDDAGHTYLWREQGHKNKTEAQIQCAGIDFSATFTDPDGADIWPYTAYVYDAVWAAAYAVDTYFSTPGVSQECDFGSRCMDGDKLMDALMNNVSFMGASSFTKSFPGMPSYSYYGRGDREEGHYYTLWNFHGDAFDASGGVDGFVYVGNWYIADGMGLTTLCADDLDGYQDYYGVLPTQKSTTLRVNKCSQILYNTKDGKPALDTPPLIVVWFPDAVSSFLIAWGILTLLVSLFCVLLTYEYGFTRLIKASQAEMMYMLEFGGLLAGGRILSAASPMSNGSCVANIWLGHLSFWFVFASLSVKTYRVHRIINNTSLKRVKFTPKDTLMMVGTVVFAVTVYLAIETGVGLPHMSFISTTLSNQTTNKLECAFRYAQFNTTLYVLEGVALLLVARLCWAIKDAPDSVNESKFIAMAMAVIILLCALVMPIVYLLDLVPWQQELIASVFFGVAGMAAQAIIVGPKAFVLLQGLDVGGLDGKLVEQTRPQGGSRVLDSMAAAVMKKEKKEKKKEKRLAEEENTGELILASSVLKGPYAERVVICREQLAKWRAMLAVVENGSLNDSGSGSNSNSNSNSITSSAYRHSSTGGDQDLDRPASFRVNRQRHPSMNSINEDDPTATAPFTTATNTLSKVEDV